MAVIIGGNRAVTIQCRWNLTSIADQNNDTRLRNHESIAKLILNSWKTSLRWRETSTISDPPFPPSHQYFQHIFFYDLSFIKNYEKCYYSIRHGVLATTKGKTGRRIDSWRLPDISAEKFATGVSRRTGVEEKGNGGEGAYTDRVNGRRSAVRSSPPPPRTREKSTFFRRSIRGEPSGDRVSEG